MYLAKQQHDDNDDNDDDDDHFGVSRSAVVDAVENDVVVEDEQRPGTTSGQPSSTRDRETQMRQQLWNAQRLTRDDEELDDEDDDDNFAAVASDGGATSRVIVVGWDSFRSRLMLFLIACLVIWACVFFPLLDT